MRRMFQVTGSAVGIKVLKLCTHRIRAKGSHKFITGCHGVLTHLSEGLYFGLGERLAICRQDAEGLMFS